MARSVLDPPVLAARLYLPMTAQRFGRSLDVVKNRREAHQVVPVANVVEASGAQGIDVVLMKPIRELVERRMADGHGDGDISGLVELLRR
jgi:hypothetical protein